MAAGVAKKFGKVRDVQAHPTTKLVRLPDNKQSTDRTNMSVTMALLCLCAANASL